MYDCRARFGFDHYAMFPEQGVQRSNSVLAVLKMSHLPPEIWQCPCTTLKEDRVVRSVGNSPIRENPDLKRKVTGHLRLIALSRPRKSELGRLCSSWTNRRAQGMRQLSQEFRIAQRVRNGPTNSNAMVAPIVRAIMLRPSSGRACAATRAMPTATPAWGKSAIP